ncbi:hypothetical protein PR048_026132 [Dryococelus australis]|uniref:Uncharacterized protein n=1 Tax=Dryococelus australis TaxID=614101 RepID=A0ABQ9GKG4_9NEOP|nr:hypothetical protein PR048_026132 [Dryococelus australis]
MGSCRKEKERTTHDYLAPKCTDNNGKIWSRRGRYTRPKYLEKYFEKIVSSLGQTTRLTPGRIGLDSLRGRFRIFARGNRNGRCPLVGVFSRGSPVSLTLAFRRCSILTSLRPQRLSKTTMFKSRPNLSTPNCRFGVSLLKSLDSISSTYCAQLLTLAFDTRILGLWRPELRIDISSVAIVSVQDVNSHLMSCQVRAIEKGVSMDSPPGMRNILLLGFSMLETFQGCDLNNEGGGGDEQWGCDAIPFLPGTTGEVLPERRQNTVTSEGIGGHEQTCKGRGRQQGIEYHVLQSLSPTSEDETMAGGIMCSQSTPCIISCNRTTVIPLILAYGDMLQKTRTRDAASICFPFIRPHPPSTQLDGFISLGSEGAGIDFDDSRISAREPHLSFRIHESKYKEPGDQTMSLAGRSYYGLKREAIYSAGFTARRPESLAMTFRRVVGWCAADLGCGRLWIRIPALPRLLLPLLCITPGFLVQQNLLSNHVNTSLLEHFRPYRHRVYGINLGEVSVSTGNFAGSPLLTSGVHLFNLGEGVTIRTKLFQK